MAGSAVPLATPISYGSAAVNGQLVGFQTSSAYRPVNYGTGLQAVPAVTPVNIPPSASYPATGTAAAAGAPASGRGPGTSALNLKESPALWTVIFLVVGFIILRHVHWRKG